MDFIGEHFHSTTGEMGGYWYLRGRAPQRLMGVGYTAEGYDRNTYYERQPDSFNPKAAFIFEGVGKEERIGDFESLLMHYGAAGDEIDMVDPKLGTPANTLVLATATLFSSSYWPSSGGGHGDVKFGRQDPRNRSDLVYVEYPKGGAVFSVGSMSWCGCLFYNKYNNNVSRITENVLRKFSSST
jgi:N,N-dimethylformamidase